jgi:hypothetical protein
VNFDGRWVKVEVVRQRAQQLRRTVYRFTLIHNVLHLTSVRYEIRHSRRAPWLFRRCSYLRGASPVSGKTREPKLPADVIDEAMLKLRTSLVFERWSF